MCKTDKRCWPRVGIGAIKIVIVMNCNLTKFSKVFVCNSFNHYLIYNTNFVYTFIRDLQSIDHLCINPILWLKWSFQVNILLNNCKQNTTSLSLLAGRTVTNYQLQTWRNNNGFNPHKRMDLPNRINSKNPFPILGVLVVFFYVRFKFK